MRKRVIDRVFKSNQPVRRIGFIEVLKQTTDRTVDESEFKTELWKLITPLYMMENRERSGILVEQWLCHSPSLFREVALGESIPIYDTEVDRLENGELVITLIAERK